MEIQTEEPVFVNPEPQQADDQVYLEDGDNNEVQNEKNVDTMEVEEEPTATSGQGVAPVASASESVEVTFFQNQKLPEFKEEMKKLLGEGLPGFVIKPLSQERIVELLGKVEADAGSEANKEILIKLLAEKVESSHESQAELAKKCKEYIDSVTAHFGGLAETFYMDLICNHANFKAYLDLKINYLDDFMMNTNDYSVWEIKRNDLLDEITIKDQVKVVKEQRKWKTKAFTALDKLIKGIQKIKNAGDMPKIWALKTKYDDVIQSKKPDYVEKAPKANKRKHKNIDEPAMSEAAEIEEAVGSMKKLKLSSAKTTANKDAITPVKTKVSVTKASTKKDSTQSPTEVPAADAPGSEDAKKGTKTPVKKEVEKKDNNQKNLMSFFTKKPEKKVEEPKIEKKNEIVVEHTSRFKCLGSLGVRSQWDACREAEFEKLFSGSEVVVNHSTEELLEAAQRHNHHLDTQKEVRKVFISIHDSYKRIKGRWDTASTKIDGRDPLYKDEALINYDMDSEDEMQEYNAENIDEDHPSDNESDLEEGEEEEDFIVPDGYVSAEEVANDSDDEGDEKEKQEMRQSIKMFKEDADFKNKPKMLSLALNDYEVGKDAQLDEYLQDFTIIKLVDDEYPIRPKRGKENLLGTGKAKLNPEAINDDEIVKELLCSLHGEFNKPDTVKKINIKFPACSKNSIERKISELEAAEQVKKEKISGETKSRWIIQKEFFLKYGTEEEYNKILEEKHEKEVERLKIEKEKRETEKKAKLVVPTALSQTEAESEKKEESDQGEIRETSNHSSVGGRKVVQTQLKFGQSRLNLNQNSNTQHSFYSCQVEVEIEGENSQNLERILMEREGNMPPTND